MYIKHVTNNILLDYKYFTFKLLENNVYGLKTLNSAKLKCVILFFLSFFGYVRLNLRCHNKYNFGESYLCKMHTMANNNPLKATLNCEEQARPVMPCCSVRILNNRCTFFTATRSCIKALIGQCQSCAILRQKHHNRNHDGQGKSSSGILSSQ